MHRPLYKSPFVQNKQRSDQKQLNPAIWQPPRAAIGNEKEVQKEKVMGLQGPKGEGRRLTFRARHSWHALWIVDGRLLGSAPEMELGNVVTASKTGSLVCAS
jgi:hypothetical protein